MSASSRQMLLLLLLPSMVVFGMWIGGWSATHKKELMTLKDKEIQRIENEKKAVRDSLHLANHRLDSINTVLKVVYDRDKDYDRRIAKLVKAINEIPGKYNNVSYDSLVQIIERRAAKTSK